MKNQIDILHIVRNDVIYDSRVTREALTSQQSAPNLRVAIAGYSDDLSDEIMHRGMQVFRFHPGKLRWLPKSINRFVKYFFWHKALVSRFSESGIKVIHCHELAAVIPSFSLKNSNSAKLIYDAHELETEHRQNLWASSLKWVFKIVENFFVSRVDAIISVSPSICDWYKNKFANVPVHLIRNCPEISSSKKTTAIKTKLKLKKKDLLFVYTGALVPGRYIDEILDTFEKIGQYHVCFMGKGVLETKITERSNNSKFIHFLPPVKSDQVVNMLAGATAGICLIENNSLTSKYCLPNKLFETCAAGMPIIVNELPDLKNFVKSNECGWILPDGKGQLTKFLESTTPSNFERQKQKLSPIKSKFTWETEGKLLLQIYRKLMQTNR